MSSNATRPKPRPRPRPRAPATASLNTNAPPSSSPGPSSAVSATAPPVLQTIEDEDALFMRNRTREEWKQFSRMAEAKETRKRKSSASNSSDEENRGSSPRASNRRKKSQPKKKNDALPDWTKKKPKEIIISSDSDSDSDILVEDKPRKSANGTQESSPQSKSKRARSRSITPPPALPQYAIQRAQAAVEQLVGSGPRAVTPTYELDESTDNIALDPELASIARRVQSEALRGDTPETDLGGPEEVMLKVVWRPHPHDPDGRADSWGVTQKRHANFYKMFDEIADLASIRVENMVVCYEGKRVFPSSNPHSIGIWAEAELEACEKRTYEYLKEHKRMRSPSAAPFLPHVGDGSRRSPSRARSLSIEELSDSDEAPTASSPPKDESSNTFHLLVRSERTKDKDITLIVRPTTKCGAIVRAFLKKAGLEAEYPADGAPSKGRGRGKAATKVPALSVDGDRMDPETEIGEADLEDGDQVEVVGL